MSGSDSTSKLHSTVTASFSSNSASKPRLTTGTPLLQALGSGVPLMPAQTLLYDQPLVFSASPIPVPTSASALSSVQDRARSFQSLQAFGARRSLTTLPPTTQDGDFALALQLQEIEQLERKAGTRVEWGSTDREAKFQHDLRQAAQNSLEEDKESESAKRLEAIALSFGYLCRDMPRDGNCFFHAVVDQLKAHPDFKGYSHMQLRALANNHIRDNALLYEKSLSNYQAFLKGSGPGKDVESPQIVALSRALQITFVIVQNKRGVVAIKQPNAKAVVYLGYQYGIHYQSLFPEDNALFSTKRAALQKEVEATEVDKVDIALKKGTATDLTTSMVEMTLEAWIEQAESLCTALLRSEQPFLKTSAEAFHRTVLTLKDQQQADQKAYASRYHQLAQRLNTLMDIKPEQLLQVESEIEQELKDLEARVEAAYSDPTPSIVSSCKSIEQVLSQQEEKLSKAAKVNTILRRTLQGSLTQLAERQQLCCVLRTTFLDCWSSAQKKIKTENQAHLTKLAYRWAQHKARLRSPLVCWALEVSAYLKTLAPEEETVQVVDALRKALTCWQEKYQSSQPQLVELKQNFSLVSDEKAHLSLRSALEACDASAKNLEAQLQALIDRYAEQKEAVREALPLTEGEENQMSLKSLLADLTQKIDKLKDLLERFKMECIKQAQVNKQYLDISPEDHSSLSLKKREELDKKVEAVDLDKTDISLKKQSVQEVKVLPIQITVAEYSEKKQTKQKEEKLQLLPYMNKALKEQFYLFPDSNPESASQILTEQPSKSTSSLEISKKRMIPFSVSSLLNFFLSSNVLKEDEKREVPADTELPKMSPWVKKKLEDPKLKLESKQSIECIVSCINIGKREAKKTKKKDLVLFLGDTGAGKSTAINYLHGCKMESIKRNKLEGLKGTGKVIRVDPKSPVKEFAKIGHSKCSMTSMPRVTEDKNFTYCDCPGFFDNRGAEINIANLANIKNMFRSARSVKIVVIIDYHSLKAQRGASIPSLSNILCQLFQSEENLQKNSKAIAIGVTKIPEGEEVTLEEIEDDICDIPLFQKLKGNIFIFDPTEKNKLGYLKKDQIINKIKALNPIRKAELLFNMPLSFEDKQRLEEISQDISKHIEKLLATDAALNQKSIQKAASYLETLGHLKIIEHKFIEKLYQENIDRIKSCANNFAQKSETLINEFQFESSKKYISLLYYLSKIFPKCEIYKILVRIQIFFFEKKIEQAEKELWNTFEKRYLDDKFINQIWSIFVLSDYSPGSEYLNFYFPQLQEIEVFRETVSHLRNYLEYLCDFTKKSHFKSSEKERIIKIQETRCIGVLERISKASCRAVLSRIEVEVKKLSEELSTQVTWNSQGQKVFHSLKKLDIDSNQKSFEQVLLGLKKIAAIEHRVECLIACFEKLKEIASFLNNEDISSVSQQEVIRKFIQLRESLQRDKNREEAKKLVHAIKEDLEEHNFENAKNKLKKVADLDKFQMGGKEALEACTQRLRDSFNNGLSSGNYDAVKINWEYMKELKKTLSLPLEEYRIPVDLKDMGENIRTHIHSLEKVFDRELKAAFTPKRLSSALTVADTPLKKLTSYWKAADIFPDFNYPEKTFQEITLSFIELIKEVFDDAYKVLSYQSRSLLFIQLYAVADATSQKSIIDSVSKIIAGFLESYKDEVELSFIGMQLSNLTQCDGVSRHAGTILEGHKQFKRFNIKLFNAKASKNSDQIFKELKLEDDKALPILEESFSIYKDKYETIVLAIIREFKTGTLSTIRNNIREEAAIQSENFSISKGGLLYLSSRHKLVGEILATIFGGWSYLDVEDEGRGTFLQDRTNLLQPHPMQIISILLLLGLGNPSRGLKNRLIQIKTGEGKSLVIAGTAVLLALMGYKIDIACYSQYLSRRDRSQYKQLFDFFGVKEKIDYNKFDFFINQRIEEIGDTRKLTKQLLEDKVHGETGNPADPNRILLIDEVDVFFSDSFLGKMYNPLTCICNSNFRDLLMKIWKNRQLYLENEEKAKHVIAKDPLMIKFLEKYPNAKIFLEITLEEIISSLKSVEKGKHTYKCYSKKDACLEQESDQKILSYKEGIGYIDNDSGDVGFNTYCGYKTAFAYIKEADKFSEGVIESNVSFNLCAGLISYAELLDRYKYKFGVSGTLESLGDIEKEIIRGFDIESQSYYMPSLFNKNKLEGSETVEVYGGEIAAEDAKGYFCNLRKEVDEIIRADRAVLVVFEELERLKGFKNYLARHPVVGSEINELSSDTPHEQKSIITSAAATRRQITLLTRLFGRGSDFVCRDSELRKNGGVHVIQTFFSEQESEEIQIKGRTCRQDDPGSYKMILFLEDLEKFEITKQSDLDQFFAYPCYLVTLEDKPLIDFKEKAIYYYRNKKDGQIFALIHHDKDQYETLNLSKLAKIKQLSPLLEKLSWPSKKTHAPKRSQIHSPQIELKLDKASQFELMNLITANFKKLPCYIEKENADRWYTFLQVKRKILLNRKLKGLKESMQQAKKKHENTIRFIDLLEGTKNSLYFVPERDLEERRKVKDKAEALNLLEQFQR